MFRDVDRDNSDELRWLTRLQPGSSDSPFKKILSANWGSLTDVGASLHLYVPRIPHRSIDILGAINASNVEWLRAEISCRELQPTDIDVYGEPFLNVIFGVPFFRRGSQSRGTMKKMVLADYLNSSMSSDAWNKAMNTYEW